MLLIIVFIILITTHPDPLFLSLVFHLFPDCTEVTCSNNIVQTESLLFPDFNRTFTWDPKVVVTTRAFQLDFPEPGMRQIPNSETCPDEHIYHIIAYQRTGPVTIGTFCRDEGITRIQVT